RFRPHLAAEAVAVRAADTGRASAVIAGKNRERRVERLPAQPPRRRIKYLSFLVVRHGWQRQRLAPRGTVRGIVATHAQVVLRFLVVRLQLIVREGPILQAASGDRPEM